MTIGKAYLDYYSDFWELDAVNGTSSDTIIKCTKAHFAHYSIPEKVITDNGPQFRAQTLPSNGVSIMSPVPHIIAKVLESAVKIA